MKTKIPAFVLVVWCVMATGPAYSVDAQYTVNGKTITCTVTDIFKLIIGPWKSFNINYGFCNDNHKIYGCTDAGHDSFSCTDIDSGPSMQDCNGSRYAFARGYKRLELAPGTSGAQKKVCDQLFDSLKVTVTPLK